MGVQAAPNSLSSPSILLTRGRGRAKSGVAAAYGAISSLPHRWSQAHAHASPGQATPAPPARPSPRGRSLSAGYMGPCGAPVTCQKVLPHLSLPLQLTRPLARQRRPRQRPPPLHPPRPRCQPPAPPPRRPATQPAAACGTSPASGRRCAAAPPGRGSASGRRCRLREPGRKAGSGSSMSAKHYGTVCAQVCLPARRCRAAGAMPATSEESGSTAGPRRRCS